MARSHLLLTALNRAQIISAVSGVRRLTTLFVELLTICCFGRLLKRRHLILVIKRIQYFKAVIMILSTVKRTL